MVETQSRRLFANLTRDNKRRNIMAISTLKQNKLDKAYKEVTKQKNWIEMEEPYIDKYSKPCICQHGNSCGERIPDYDKDVAVMKADYAELKRLKNEVIELEKKYGIR
jgi:hypothetical protein